MNHKIATGIFAVLGLVALLWPAEPEIRWVFLVGLVVIYGCLTAYGSYAIGANWFLKSVTRFSGNAIALTFDDGPEPAVTPLILEILREKDVKATFFLIGKKAEAHPALVRRIRDEGHVIGNHSYSHNPGIAFFSLRRLKTDLERCSDVLERITGEEVRLFRPPFGVTTPRYAKVLRELRLDSVGWSLRSYDTVSREDESLQKRLRRRLSPGTIVLFHDNQAVTARILADFIEFCKAGNFKIGQVGPGNVANRNL